MGYSHPTRSHDLLFFGGYLCVGTFLGTAFKKPNIHCQASDSPTAMDALRREEAGLASASAMQVRSGQQVGDQQVGDGSESSLGPCDQGVGEKAMQQALRHHEGDQGDWMGPSQWWYLWRDRPMCQALFFVLC
jgi:hypothetical protein